MRHNPTATRKGSRSRFTIAVLSALALGSGLAGTGFAAAQAAGTPLTDVAAGITADATAIGEFDVTGTIENTGQLAQHGSTLTITATDGTITDRGGCAPSGSAAVVCTAVSLPPDATVSFPIKVTPNAGATVVGTKAESHAAVVEVSIPPPNPDDDTATASTTVLYGSTSSIVSDPSEVQNGTRTILRATVTNTKFVDTFTVKVETGGTFDTNVLPLPDGCGQPGLPDDPAVTCTVTLAHGEDESWDFASKTPTGSSMVSKVTSSGSEVPSTGNSRSVSEAQVTTTMSGLAAAFTPDGSSLSHTGAPGSQTFSVPLNSTIGLILRLGTKHYDNPPSCGTGPCQPDAFEALFPNTGPYSAGDVNNPLLWEIVPAKNVCNGVSGTKCVPLRMIRSFILGPNGTNVADGRVEPIPLCQTFDTGLQPTLRAIDEVCLTHVRPLGNGPKRGYGLALLKDIEIPIFG